MLSTNFNWLRNVFNSFIITILNYIKFLYQQHNITTANHTSETPVRSIDQAITIKVHNQNIWIIPVNKTKYFHFKQLLINLPMWKPVDIEKYLPNDPIKLQANAPHYHTRTMRINYLRICDLLLPKVKPSSLRTI
ncbi:hypothetical protein Glove_219g66 [Diversispora epigaea]|uniref:Uncharacterized protein n=1 Tax=Diversispora epigaea TaxID=1348612 RepID=A0A397IFX2_9GLOM|nr:hypothetical protein Glove_219g66 [Diversispora epigaea]